MVIRKSWLDRINALWGKKSIIWLSGVRRTGKTFLCQSISDIEYFDCELPRIRQQMEDPEAFLSGLRSKRLILDEIHRIHNPSELLKIAADHFPDIKIIATGSSTLGASKKFRDTLTGRKVLLWLTPMTMSDIYDFQNIDLSHRFLFGGLPPFFLPNNIPEGDFQSWMDDYWTKDIQELFRLERKYSFQKFMELLFAQSGGIFEANKFARPCEISRQTVNNYLSVLDATYIVHIIRPFSSHLPTEIISAPKVYAFDTGFICYYKGWRELRNDDNGLLWEHFVLNEMQANLQTRRIKYWRDKQGHEIDFVIATDNDKKPTVIECKWSMNNFDPANLIAFRKKYKHGNNFVAVNDVDHKITKKIKDDLSVTFLGLRSLVEELTLINTEAGSLSL